MMPLLNRRALVSRLRFVVVFNSRASERRATRGFATFTLSASARCPARVHTRTLLVQSTTYRRRIRCGLAMVYPSAKERKEEEEEEGGREGRRPCLSPY